MHENSDCMHDATWASSNQEAAKKRIGDQMGNLPELNSVWVRVIGYDL